MKGISKASTLAAGAAMAAHASNPTPSRQGAVPEAHPVAWMMFLRLPSGDVVAVPTKHEDDIKKAGEHLIEARPLVFGDTHPTPPREAGAASWVVDGMVVTPGIVSGLMKRNAELEQAREAGAVPDDLYKAAGALIAAYNGQRPDTEKDSAWTALCRAYRAATPVAPFPSARRRRAVQIVAIPPLEGVHPGATMLLCDDGSVWTQANSAGASWCRDDLSAVEFGE